MKFFQWLRKSRENEEVLKYRSFPPSELDHQMTKRLLLVSTPETGRIYELKPSPTTFYPPIEERKDQLNIHGGKACRCQKCLSEIYISTSASEGSVGFVSISEED